LEKIVYDLSQLDKGSLDDTGDLADDGEAEDDDSRLEALADKAHRCELGADDLTEDELQRFHSELKRGSLGHALEVWEPWWQRAAVVDLDSIDDADVRFTQPPHLCCTPSRQAHPAVAFTAVQAVYAYAHLMRAFNGDWAWDPVQAAMHLLQLGKAACSDTAYESVSECLQAALRAAAGLTGGGFGAEFDELCLSDATAILSRGGDAAGFALSGAATLVGRAVAQVAEERAGRPKLLGRLRRAAKKLEFLTAFACHHGAALTPLADEVRALHKLRQDEAQKLRDAGNARAHDGIAVPERGS